MLPCGPMRAVPPIELRCRGVRASFGTFHAKNCEPGRRYVYARARARRLHHYNPASQTFLSKPCATLQAFLPYHIEQIKKFSPGEQVRSLPHYRELRKQLAEHMEKWKPSPKKGQEVQALTDARRQGRGGLGGERRARLTMTSAWRRPTKKGRGGHWEIRLCRRCQRMLMVSTAATAWSNRYHRPCWKAALQTDAGRQWWARRLELRRRGSSQDDVNGKLGPNPPSVHRLGRQRVARELTRDFGWAVRHYLGGESKSSLAREAAGGDTIRVSRAIRTVISLLPAPELATMRFRRYVVALQLAADQTNAA